MSCEKKSHNQRITIKDIAALANVSIGTVDRVLHNRGEVNMETRDRVMFIIEKHGYKPNLIAKSLALKKSFHIAVLIPSADEKNPYWAKPVRGFFMAAEELNDFNTRITLYHYDPGDEMSFITETERMLSSHPDGIVLAPHFQNAAKALIRKCKGLDIPVICVDNNLEDEHILAYFGQNAFQSGKVAAKLMNFSLKDGSKVLIVNIAPNKAVTHHMQQREGGFIDYFQTVMPDHHIKTLSVTIDLLAEDEPSCTLRKILSEHRDIRGIFVTNSRAHKVAGAFSSDGKGNIMLVGYDMMEDNVFYLDKGLIDILICQKPENQGYQSVMAMFHFLFTGRQIEKINYSPIDIITKENISYYHSNETICQQGLSLR
jgi:LacI family transcriptional regulator